MYKKALTLIPSKTWLSYILAVCCAVLAGCSKAPSNTYQTYIARLSNTLEAQAPGLSKPEAISPLLPPNTLLNTTTISLIELASLCMTFKHPFLFVSTLACKVNQNTPKNVPFIDKVKILATFRNHGKASFLS